MVGSGERIFNTPTRQAGIPLSFFLCDFCTLALISSSQSADADRGRDIPRT